MTAERTIALWHPFSPDAVGLPEDQVIRVHSKPQVAALRYLAARGWRSRVEYLCRKPLPYRRSEGDIEWCFWPRLPIQAQGPTAYRRERSPLALLSLLVAPPDVLVINISGHTSALARAMARLCKARGRPYIAMIGGVQFSFTPENMRYYREASAIITHTHAQKAQIEQLPQFVGCHIGVMTLGVDPLRFCPAPNRRSLGAPGLLYVGRWVAWKGLHRAVEAFSDVRRAYPGAQFHIIGPESDPDYAASIRAQIAVLGLGDAVHFHGPMAQDALLPWYQAADFFLLVSDPGAESFGMVVIESMACGTPVVALRAEGGGPAEIIDHGIDGLLVDSAEIGPAIAEMYSDPVRYAGMRAAARHKAETQYSETVTAQAFETIVTEALRRNGPSGKSKA